MARYSRLHFCCPEEHVSWKETAFGKFFCFKFATGAFFLKTLRKLFLSSEKSAIYMSTETFWRKNVLFFDTKLFFLFRDIDRGIFGTFRQKNFVRFVENSIQRIRRIQLMEILPLRNLELCNQLRTLKKQSLDFFLDNFATVGKNVLAHSGYN